VKACRENGWETFPLHEKEAVPQNQVYWTGIDMAPKDDANALVLYIS
jgi:hypothetical protein